MVIERAGQHDLPALQVARDVPYLNMDESRIVLDPANAKNMQMFLAREEASGDIAGIIVLFTPQDGSKQAGIYGAGVRCDLQRRGIGSALTAMACQAARGTGAHAISLNATPSGERVYRKLGFEVIGDGQTWFMRFR
jgi:ribosomal protein S18 acetylase RimI-like enzyme